ncbi:lipopolysaccharide heptosyltransferase I [Stutzerimonas zhaodongensis]|uniref:Lipopolysaccharide heptosyltransferase 1 n=1 Tax=Stutzerimonas zhaodongensis TaxID=1176257 RepID=A0A365PQQ7_9GAMM|nr:lipopolysaccharide heptosyltransferase I [Stutzerimonas zhaodongensis]RBA52964.1 lipopolysaccharide heptosyltransferase I [Stutzerimonas zhaodongensis]
MRVLLVKTSSLGDVIHTLPALTDAQRAIPGIQFDWVVEEGFAEIPAWHPAVAQVIPVAIRRWRKHPLQTLRSGEWRRFKARLRETRYDLVIDAQGLLKSAWLTRYVKAPVAGFDRDSIREPLASRFYDRCYAVPRDQHALERVRQLFAQALGYSIPDLIADYGLDRSQLATPGEQPYLLFLHGTTWPSKHWPEAYWRQLAERMSEFGWAIRLPWGNAEEKARAERIAQGLPSASVLPRLNLGGVAKVVAGARACVAVDTGLGHLAAALDVPSISLYGPTLPGRVGAYGRSQVHLCAPGPNAGKGDRHKPCFDGLSAEHVASELKALLRSSETP